MREKGDKFRTNIEGEERYFRYVDDVIDHIQDKVYFEVDAYDLRVNLKDLNKHEYLALRNDCMITRIS